MFEVFPIALLRHNPIKPTKRICWRLSDHCKHVRTICALTRTAHSGFSSLLLRAASEAALCTEALQSTYIRFVVHVALLTAKMLPHNLCRPIQSALFTSPGPNLSWPQGPQIFIQPIRGSLGIVSFASFGYCPSSPVPSAYSAYSLLSARTADIIHQQSFWIHVYDICVFTCHRRHLRDRNWIRDAGFCWENDNTLTKDYYDNVCPGNWQTMRHSPIFQ